MIPKNSIFFLLVLLTITSCSNSSEESPIPVNRTDECFGLNQTECFEAETCAGSYGSSSDNFGNGPTTMDRVFKDCYPIPEERYNKAVQDKELCESSEGSWTPHEDKVLGSCNCGRNDTTKKLNYFVETEGCMTLPEACIIANGTYYDTDELSCELATDSDWFVVCPKDAKTNPLEACICPNGKPWRDGGNPKYCDY